MSIQTVNPATNKVVKSFEEMTDKEVHAAVDQAEKTFHRWRKTTYAERAALLQSSRANAKEEN